MTGSEPRAEGLCRARYLEVVFGNRPGLQVVCVPAGLQTQATAIHLWGTSPASSVDMRKPGA